VEGGRSEGRRGRDEKWEGERATQRHLQIRRQMEREGDRRLEERETRQGDECHCVDKTKCSI